jgi:hypothetical protein
MIKFKKTLLLISLFTLFTVEAKPLCKEVVTNQFNDYVIKREAFVRDNECITSSSEMIVNKESNQTMKLDGFVTGIESISLDEEEILKVNYHAGVHTNVVEFFTIAKNGDLSKIEGGAIGSDVGNPAIYLDGLNGVLVVFSRYAKDTFDTGKPCRILMEDIYEYKNKKFIKIVEHAIAPAECGE